MGGILAGLLWEGGRLGQIIQPTAAMIVFGGTFGAVLLQFPLSIVLASIKRLGQVFFNSQGEPQQLIKEIVGFAHKARKEGIVSLDRELDKHQGALSSQIPDAGGGRHRTPGTPQDDGA